MESAYLILLAAFILLEVYCDYLEPAKALVDLWPGSPRKEKAENKKSECIVTISSKRSTQKSAS